ncbi:hypothetical protein J6590_050035 [Homalodisca vitripennis]|nr:hypothetical protein J6590_050035 [Homalodisca vitripennis]
MCRRPLAYVKYPAKRSIGVTMCGRPLAYVKQPAKRGVGVTMCGRPLTYIKRLPVLCHECENNIGHEPIIMRKLTRFQTLLGPDIESIM